MRSGGHRPTPGSHPVGQVRPQSCDGGQSGLLLMVLQRVGGKRHHGGRVSRVPGADVANVHISVWPATPQAGPGAVCSLLGFPHLPPVRLGRAAGDLRIPSQPPT